MLPELPKQNKRKESDFCEVFRKWWEKNKKRISRGSYELKDTRGKNYLSYSEITNEQFNSGMANKSHEGNLIRVINGTPGTGDFILLKDSYAYVVVRFPKKFFIIDIETLLMERNKKRKSLTYERALDIAVISV